MKPTSFVIPGSRLFPLQLLGLLFCSALLLFLFVRCGEKSTPLNLPPGDPGNGGLLLPEGFEALVVADTIPGRARQIDVNDKGDVYVKLQFPREDGGCVILRDTSGDGKADIVEHFAKYDTEGQWSLQTGMQVYEGYVYFSSDLNVFRYRLDPETQLPVGEMETVVIDDHAHGRHEHIAKPLAFDNKGHIYVPFGAPSNACQDPKRTPGAPGLDPCPQLEDHAGVWRFDAMKLNQRQEDGEKYATGIRSIVAMDWNPADEELYVVIHGRDDLLRLWPQLFDAWESAMLPSEEFVRVTKGSDFGWPYCYYDQLQEKKVLAPEYGGDGKSTVRCEDYDLPLIGFPGHWAPNGLVFYQGDQFPERYRNGAFIAFHGSTIRAPYPQSGYFVAFVPFENGQPSGEWEVFINGFAAVDPIVNVSDAVYRPMGLAVGPDGSLYVGDTEKGRIWRVMFKGDKSSFGPAQLASMEEQKTASNVRTPDKIEDNLQKDELAGGEYIYFTYCGICHQRNGKGASGRFPPLAGTDWVTGDKDRLIGILLNGLEGNIVVNGESYNQAMPQHSFLSDKDAASVLTYIRQNFGNTASEVTEAEVQAVRAKLPVATPAAE